MKTWIKSLAALAALGGSLLAAHPAAAQQAGTQFMGILGYRVGPYGANGAAFFTGMIDYLNLVNERDGGINGVKLSWEECETEYNNAKGVECYERLKTRTATGPTAIHPMSTGITYGLIDKAPVDKVPLITLGYGRTDATDGRVFPWVFPILSNYWDGATGIVKFIDDREQGSLKGKKIVLLYHDSAYGKEPHPVLEAEAAKHGFELRMIPVPHPGNEQQSQWLQIRQYKPDWVILWGWGVMSATALSTAQKVGYPRDRMVGIWWAGSEIDTEAAGPAAEGYYAASLNLAGKDFPVVRDVEKFVYARNKGGDPRLVGTVLWNRGLAAAMFTVEAVRTAQGKYGKKPMNGEQARWGIENLNIDQKRLDQLGFGSMVPPLKLSCADHGGSGLVRFQKWEGGKWKAASDWMSGDRALIRKMVEESADKYAKEKNITPGCMKG
ncbi:MAG TPA: ABC transporter substrate-binding protein [Burkholderiales bacterium]|jgi:branched-chain amino acid transport system substrate-binding protein|nr:ABC transporter substrate-binding protein [Burkholderiales bacterium]